METSKKSWHFLSVKKSMPFTLFFYHIRRRPRLRLESGRLEGCRFHPWPLQSMCRNYLGQRTETPNVSWKHSHHHYGSQLGDDTLDDTLFHQCTNICVNVASVIKGFGESVRLERRYINGSPFTSTSFREKKNCQTDERPKSSKEIPRPKNKNKKITFSSWWMEF